MKKKLTIALVAILSFSLLLAGCTTAATTATQQSTNEAAGNGYANDGDANHDYENSAASEAVEVGSGYHGNATAESSYNGSGTENGYGTEAGYNETNSDNCEDCDECTTAGDPDYTLTEQDQTLSLVGYGSEGALDDSSLTLADMLTYAIQDEYLARAEYELIMDEYGEIRPFTNIMEAEETHIDALLPLFETYGITAPADEGASHALSVASLTSAYEAGVNAEVNNIAMYETFLEQDLPSDVRTVFESLMKASENHLRAFQNKL